MLYPPLSEATRGLGSRRKPPPQRCPHCPGRKLVLILFEFERSHLVSANLLSLPLLLYIKAGGFY